MDNKDDIDGEYLDMMVHNFKYAIDNNKDKVYLGYIYDEDSNKKEFWVKKEEWVSTLDILLENAIILEEYEYCNEIKKIKASL